MENQAKLPEISKNRKKIIYFFIFSVFFAISCTITYYFSTSYLPTSTQVASNLSTSQCKIYFISLAKSQLENNAKSLAGDYQVLGAGGYVWKFDDYFHVVASCYEKENDAVLVQNNIKTNLNLDSELFCVQFSGLNFSGDYTADEKKVLSRALKITFTTYQELFDIAVSLDTNVYNEISARLAVNSCYSAYNSALADFNTLFADYESLSNLHDLLEDELKILEKLCSGKLINRGQTYCSLIKYHYTNLLNRYYQFLQ